MAVGVVHGKADLGDARPTVVLSDSSPCVTERVDTIPFLLGDTHASAHLLYSVVHIRTKRVGVAVPIVEVEQVGVISLGKIFFN